MSVVGDFTISAGAFALEHALATVPDISVEADRLASHGPQEVFPFLWATGGDFQQFYRALEDDPSVTDVNICEESGEEVLYRLEWDDDFCELIQDVVDHHAAIMEATAHGAQWNLRLRFAEEEMLSEFQSHFRESSHRFDVNKLYHPTEPRQRAFGLTSEQHAALVAAVEQGYYSIPRKASTNDVSDSLGISGNAASERIRRGCETLIKSTLMGPEEFG